MVKVKTPMTFLAHHPKKSEIVVTGKRVASKPVQGLNAPIIVDLPLDPKPDEPGDVDIRDGCQPSRNELVEALANLQPRLWAAVSTPARRGECQAEAIGR